MIARLSSFHNLAKCPYRGEGLDSDLAICILIGMPMRTFQLSDDAHMRLCLFASARFGGNCSAAIRALIDAASPPTGDPSPQPRPYRPSRRVRATPILHALAASRALNDVGHSLRDLQDWRAAVTSWIRTGAPPPPYVLANSHVLEAIGAPLSAIEDCFGGPANVRR